MTEPVLECEQCGDVVKVLTPEEVQRLARDPHAVYPLCRACIRSFKGVL